MACYPWADPEALVHVGEGGGIGQTTAVEVGYLQAYQESSRHLPPGSATAERNVCPRALPQIQGGKDVEGQRECYPTSFSPDLFGREPSTRNGRLCPQNRLEDKLH